MLSVKTAVWRSTSGALLDAATVVAESAVAALFLPPHAVIINEAGKRMAQMVIFRMEICCVFMEFELGDFVISITQRTGGHRRLANQLCGKNHQICWNRYKI
jgi:hypothetical protein